MEPAPRAPRAHVTHDEGEHAPAARRAGALARAGFCVIGIGALAASAASRPSLALLATKQDWPPFVLVAGLLVVGLVADEAGVYAAAGTLLGRLARTEVSLFVGAVVLVAVVSALLNLDTSVAFLTPVLLYTARAVGVEESPLLYGVPLLSNASSLFLPGSNLTNLIVLGHLHLRGGAFLARMWLPGLVAVTVTAGFLAWHERALLGTREALRPPRPRPPGLLGLAAVAGAAVLVVASANPAGWVAGLAAILVLFQLTRRRVELRDVHRALGLPVLIGLFGVAIGLGTLGRAWAGPAQLLSHLDASGTLALAAVASVLVNNLPAASLLAARVPPHPFALLVGLNLGPNLFVSGSLAWFLWLRAARGAGAAPSIARASRLGLLAAPAALAASGLLLVLAGRT